MRKSEREREGDVYYIYTQRKSEREREREIENGPQYSIIENVRPSIYPSVINEIGKFDFLGCYLT